MLRTILPWQLRASVAGLRALSTSVPQRIKVAQRAPLDWDTLGFDYTPTTSHIEFTWRKGSWDTGVLVTQPVVTIHLMSGALHYGQAIFEGLKCFEGKDGEVRQPSA